MSLEHGNKEMITLPVVKTKSKWVAGILTFYDDAVNFTGGTQIDGTAVTATAVELNQYAVSVDFADANTAGSIFVVAPHAGNIVGLHAVNAIANTTTKTVLTAKIATVLVTTPAWEIAITQAAGVVSNSIPTAANVVTAGQVIEIITDGGGTPVMPTSITIVISR